MNKTPLYTIGYSGFSPERFLETLKGAQVEILVDVRQRALSRKRGFSKSALRELVESNGIEYLHVRELGAPEHLRELLRSGMSIEEYMNDFGVYLGSCGPTLERLYGIATKRRCCLMCVERTVRECHRSVVAEALLTRNGRKLKVTHL